MIVHNAEIIATAVKQEQYPETTLPEIALAGRSNVGKSSFINKMINRKALARTSSNPGKTQTLNFYKIEDRLLFVDVPGYGYAKVSQSQRSAWGTMIESYLLKRSQLRAVLQLIDIRHEPSAQDKAMYDWLTFHGLEVFHVLTKADKIPRGKWQQHAAVIRRQLGVQDASRMALFSAETGQGKEEVWQAIEQWLELR